MPFVMHKDQWGSEFLKINRAATSAGIMKGIVDFLG